MIKRFIGIALILAAAIALCLYSVSLLFVLISLIMVYIYLGRKLDIALFESRIFLGLTTVFVYACMLSLLVVVGGLVAPINLVGASLLGAVVIGGLLGYEVYVNKAKPIKRKPITIADTLSLVVAVIAVMLVTIVPFHLSGLQQKPDSFLLTFTGNEDGAEHLGIFNDYLQFNTIDTRTVQQNQPHNNFFNSIYPSGWHGANAVLASSAVPSLKPSIQSAQVFAFLNVFWFFVLVFFSARYCFILFSLFVQKQRKSWPAYVAIVLSLLVGIYLFTLSMFQLDFFPFIAQLITTILFLITLHQLRNNGIGSSKSGFGLVALLCSMSVVSWILLLPVFLIVAIVALVALKLDRKNSITKSTVIAELRFNWPLYLLAFAGVVGQVIRVLTHGSGTTGLAFLLMDGGVPGYDFTTYLALGIGLAGAIYISRKNKQVIHEPAFILVVATLLFALGILVLQIYKTGGIHYYYYKTLLLIPVAVVPLAVAVFGSIVNKVRSNSLLFSILLAIIVPCVIIQFLPLDKGTISYIKGSRPITAAVNESVYAQAKQSSFTDKQVDVYIGGSSPFASDVATLYSNMLRPESSCFDNLRATYALAADVSSAVSALQNNTPPASCDGFNIHVFVDPAYAKLIDPSTITNYAITILP